MRKLFFILKIHVFQSPDDDLNVGIDSVIAIPLEDWDLDFVTPNTKCVKRNGTCIPFTFSDPPDQSVILPFIGENDQPATNVPNGVFDDDRPVLYVDSENVIGDVIGTVPKPGYYVLVANYYQPGNGFDIPVNVTFANPGEALDVEELLANGQYVEAVLPVPTCAMNSGCRSVITTPDGNKDFSLQELFLLSTDVR